MITSTKNYPKTKNKKTDRQNSRTNGKSKAIQTKLHKEAQTCTHTKREKGKNIYLYIYLKNGREPPNQQRNLPMIINSKC